MMFSVIAFADDDIGGGGDEAMTAISSFITMAVNFATTLSIFLGLLFLISIIVRMVRDRDGSSHSKKLSLMSLIAVMSVCVFLLNPNLSAQFISKTVMGTGACISDTNVTPSDDCYDYKSSEFMQGHVAEAIAKVKAEKGLKIEGYIELVVRGFQAIGFCYLLAAFVKLKQLADGTAGNDMSAMRATIQLAASALLMDLYHVIDSWIIPGIQYFTGPL